MTNQQPVITVSRGRRFACSPAAVLAFIVNDNDQFLMLSHPRRQGTWEVVNGALEAEETVLEGVLREVHEEAGPHIEVQPLGLLHAYTFRYDDTARYMLSLSYLLAYRGGPIEPGDDMAGSRAKWLSLEELFDDDTRVLIPPDEKWLFQRAIDLFHLWKDHPPTAEMLQPARYLVSKNKHDLFE